MRKLPGLRNSEKLAWVDTKTFYNPIRRCKRYFLFDSPKSFGDDSMRGGCVYSTMLGTMRLPQNAPTQPRPRRTLFDAKASSSPIDSADFLEKMAPGHLAILPHIRPGCTTSASANPSGLPSLDASQTRSITIEDRSSQGRLRPVTQDA